MLPCWCLKLEQHIQKEANITKYKLCEREFVCLNFAYLYLGLRNESKKKMLRNIVDYCCRSTSYNLLTSYETVQHV
jgi:hypothetical protein